MWCLPGKTQRGAESLLQVGQKPCLNASCLCVCVGGPILNQVIEVQWNGTSVRYHFDWMEKHLIHEMIQICFDNIAIQRKK